MTEKALDNNLLNGGRLYSLDVMRIIATICIVFHHFQQMYHLQFTSGINYFYGKFYFGYIVEFFFILSGILAARNIGSIRKSTFVSYVGKRYLRLVPVVALSVVVYDLLIIAAVHFTGNTSRGTGLSIKNVLISALCLHDGKILTNTGINYPMWYIGVLIVCFAVLYIVIQICSKLNIKPSFGLAAVVLLGLAIRFTGVSLPLLNEDMSRGYMAFFTGCLLSQVYIRQTEIKKWQSALSLCVTAAVLWIIVSERYFDLDEIQLVLIFCFYPALVTLFLSPTMIRLFNHKILGVAGQITYDVYVWHDCINLLLFIVVSILGLEVTDSRILMWLFAALCFAVGTLSYYGIERPLNKLLLKKKL